MLHMDLTLKLLLGRGAAIAGLLWTVSGCGSAATTCGAGTTLVDGTCVPVVDDSISCGAGTSLAGDVCVQDISAPDILAGDTGADTQTTDSAATDAADDTADATASDAPAPDLEDTDDATAVDVAPDVDSGSISDSAQDSAVDAADAGTDASSADVCAPKCLGKECGEDGCGGVCGTCNNPAFPICSEVTQKCQPVCVPKCEGKNCGADGCGGTCGACNGDQDCSTVGICVPKTWTCDASWYGTADACDCSCGAPDPDCGQPKLLLAGCDQFEKCDATGQCVPAVPVEWTCAKALYGGVDACDCDCGALDPDCAFDLPVKGCGAGGTCDPSGQCVTCTPNCADKDCGSDGCGGTCGTCSDATLSYCKAGTCVDPCADGKPVACETATCGSDGCGGTCGTCDPGSSCKFGQCVADPAGPDSCVGNCGGSAPSGCSCTAVCASFGTCCADVTAACACKPNCTDKSCGSDGCGGSCGLCDSSTPYCSNSGQCLADCAPQCDGKGCGDDGCGGVCGVCAADAVCAFTNQCVPTAWKCDKSYYSDGKACDCGCGAPDPDCSDANLAVFGCPSGVSCDAGGWCAATFCSSTESCTGTQWCVGAWPKSAGVYDGVCKVPSAAASPPGFPCSIGEGCATGLCLDGFCRSHCDADDQCLGGQICVGLPVVDGVSGAVFGFAGSCDTAFGSAMTCASQAACAAKSETCVAKVDPVTLQARYLCEPVPASPAPGASCAVLSCPTGQICAATTNGPQCALPCPAGTADCPAGWSCLERPLHNNGTPDPLDDPQVPLCLQN